MDFANEFYIRVYVRDTTTWKRLGWEGTCIFMHMLRKADPAGVLDLGELEPWEAAMLHCGAPEAFARAGMERCLKLGCLVHRAHYLVAPNYRAANEARKSDRQRQLESRTRRRLDALGLDTQEAQSQNVDARDVASRNATSASRLVTYRHKTQPSVTAGHTPSQSVTHSGSGSGSGSDSDTDSVTGGDARTRAKAPPPDLESPEIKTMADAWRRVAGAEVDEQGQAHLRALLAREPGAPARFEGAARTFVDSMRGQRKRPVLRWLCSQWAEWSAEGGPADQRRAARNAEQAATDARMRRELDTVGEPPPKALRRVNAMTAEDFERAERVAPAPERARDFAVATQAQQAVRSAQTALRDARERGAPEVELSQLTAAAHEAQRFALNEQRQAEGLPPLAVKS